MRRFFLISVLLACSLTSYSQAYKYHFRIIDLPENFKNQFITLVDEDAAGMLWFVTNNGLHRYDGNQVLTFDMQSMPALPDISIRLLFADSRNNLWIATRNQLVRFDLQRWAMIAIPFGGKQIPVLQDQSVTAITEGLDGTIYAGCGNANFYRVMNDSLEYITQLRMPKGDTTGNYSTINTIQETAKGQLWLTTSKGQIVSLYHNQAKFEQSVYCESPQLANASINFLLLSPSGKCLIDVPGSGPFLVDLKRETAAPLIGPVGLPTLQSKNVYVAGFAGGKAMFLYKNNDAGETGLAIYNPENNVFENLSSVYPPAFRSNILRGVKYKNGQVFVPNKMGIATISYTSNAFDVFASSLENTNSIRTIYKGPGTNLLIGSYLNRFIKFDETASRGTSQSDNLVSCLLPWNKDTLLAGMEGGVLSWYLLTTNTFIPIFNSTTANPVNSYAYCLSRESDTSFWTGTNTGFYLINPYNGRIIKGGIGNGSNPLSQSVVLDILKAGHNRFFATKEGLFKYNLLSEILSKQPVASGGSYTAASFSCLRLVDNRIWAGTIGNGILILDTAGNLLRKITTEDGLAGNIVFSNPLCKNYMLAGTGSGLSIINTQSGEISNYSSQYYLPANEFNRSAWCVNGDTVYLGTINGFIRINMNTLLKQQTLANPGISFSGFAISSGQNASYDYTLPYRKAPLLTIPPNANSFSIGMGGLSEIVNGLKLYYRLGASAPWQTIGQRREVTFVNVAPGDYTMQIAARLPDGQWIENLLTMPIDVQPAYYQTWWFKTLLFAAALGLIWMGIKYRERALLKEQKLRSRIAGDLHDEVGSALTRIYFQADMLSAQESANGTPATPLQKISASSQEALSSMSDMVWSIDAHYDNASDMVARMRDYLARLQDEIECRCKFEVTGTYEKKHLTQIARQNIFLIFKEAINNALKYGSEKKAVVNLTFHEDLLTLTVENEMVQHKPAANPAQGGHGLQNMQLRAEKIKGRLVVDKREKAFSICLEVKI